MTHAAAIVLAGGRSQRMGTAKALLDFGGRPLVAHNVALLSRLFDEIVVVAAPDQELPVMPVTIVRDEVPHQGPVGGLYYGLAAARADRCFVASCDAVFLNTDLICHLVARSVESDLVIPSWDGRLHPLHAVYSQSVVPILAAQLSAGERRLIDLVQKVRATRIERDEIARFDPEGMSFFNVNTPEDYEAAVRRLGTTRVGERQ
jgi:molybdopterin-guanine dinucleotide biosynthesis protein A